ncbi:MAG TPA: diguanylate cyclase [Pyrinomonadaceae bacterium]
MRILIAEDDPVSRRVLTVQLTKWGHEVLVTENGLEAWAMINRGDAPQLAILDRMMPGLDGIEICRRLRQQNSGSSTYVILLTAMSRKEDLIEGLEAGADDYLTKPFDRHELRVRLQAGARIVELQASLCDRVKELENAIIEKERAEEALRNLSLTDHLTGLYNHRGFFTLAEHALKMGRRTRQTSLLIYADMDGLKQINDSMGHASGSLAISKLAEIMRKTFRDCDIVARLGGDEFAVLAPNVCCEESDVVIQRLKKNLEIHNQANAHELLLGLSIGSISIDPDDLSTLEELVQRADTQMYFDKRFRKAQKLLANHNFSADFTTLNQQSVSRLVR